MDAYRNFDIQNFLLVDDERYIYEAAKAHSVKIDELLDFEISQTESLIQQTQDAISPGMWIGLHPQILLTPYLEIRMMLEAAIPKRKPEAEAEVEAKPKPKPEPETETEPDLNPRSSTMVIDLGCAYARMAVVIAAHYANLNFLGAELIQERIAEARRVLAKNRILNPRLELMHFDLENQTISDLLASSQNYKTDSQLIFFIYDYGSEPAIKKTLTELAKLAQSANIKVIGRGRRTRHIIHHYHPWLAEVNPPQHFKNFSIYQS